MKRNLGFFTDTDTLTWLILIGDLNLDISPIQSTTRPCQRVKVAVNEEQSSCLYRYFDTLTWSILVGVLDLLKSALPKSPHKIVTATLTL